MVVIGIEIENKYKKTHDSQTGFKIAERIKYKVLWFNNGKSEFVEKVIFESFLKQFEVQIKSKTEFEYSKKVQFTTRELELKKYKESTSYSSSSLYTDKSYKNRDEDGDKNVKSEKKNPLVTYASPIFLMSALRKVINEKAYDDQGNIKSEISNSLVKVMWFNPFQQKYSEYELPIECLKEFKE
ncbi:MAG: hypothetical protein AAFQ94_25115 [Bacteroidota bacterium]